MFGICSLFELNFISDLRKYLFDGCPITIYRYFYEEKVLHPLVKSYLCMFYSCVLFPLHLFLLSYSHICNLFSATSNNAEQEELKKKKKKKKVV